MSVGEIESIIGKCDVCRHTHGSSSCSNCGGGTGYIGPPTIPPCRACLDGIALAAAGAIVGQPEESASLEAVRAAWMMVQGFSHEEIAVALRDCPPTDIAEERSQLEAALRLHLAPTPLELAASEALRQHEAGETLEWPDQPTEVLTLGDELLLLDGDTTTVSRPAELVTPDVVATLAPLQPTWRSGLVQCAALLKAIAERDPAAAAGYVSRFNELLTRAAQYGS